MDTWLFLRSAHSSDKDRKGPPPNPDLSKGDDVWTQIFARACSMAKVLGVIARVGDPYQIVYGKNLLEIRAPDLECFADFNPSVVLNRGGYREYRSLYKRLPGGVRHIYLGCGQRWNPFKGAWSKWLEQIPWSYVLVDTEAQKDIIGGDLGSIFPKPAVDHLFYPQPQIRKEFTLVFNCHRPIVWKGCKWLASRIPNGCRVLRIGPKDSWFVKEQGRINVTFTGTIPKSNVPQWLARARVGVVCDDGVRDSGPRILPEYLAMGLPVLLRDTVRASHKVYIDSSSGRVVNDGNFAKVLRDVLKGEGFDPRGWYKNHLTVRHAARRLLQLCKVPI